MAAMAVTQPAGVPLGTLDGPEPVAADPRGAVRLATGWELDWWIGAEDRWHVPSESPTVRQGLLGACPVTETRLRVPSGDAVQRLYAARDRSGADVVVAEVTNETKVPFAVTFVLRTVDGRAPGRIDVTDRVVAVEGQVVATIPRVPGRVAFAVEGGPETDELRAVVEGGNAGLPGGSGLRGTGTQVALVYPLAHTASVRIAVPMAPVTEPIDLAGLPDAKRVVSGWQTQARQGTRLVLPERRLQEGVDARVRRSLLVGAGDPYAPEQLDLFGFPAEAEAVLRALIADATAVAEPGRALRTLGRHVAFTGDRVFARAAVDAVATLIARLASSGSVEDLRRGAVGASLATTLLGLAGHKRGATDADRAARAMTERAAALSPPGHADAVSPEAQIRATVRAASGTWRWPDDADARQGADLVEAVRDLLIAEEADGLALSPVVPIAWLGQGWEVHDAPTVHGTISFAVRWHGDRPALLWDHTGRTVDGLRLSAPGLDPTFATVEARGEALLAPVALPPTPDRKGLTIPVSIEPMPRR